MSAKVDAQINALAAQIAKAAIAGSVKEEKEEENPSLFVGNLPFSLDDDGFSKLLGNIRHASARVITGKNGKNKGFGFVQFKNEKERDFARKRLAGTEIEGRQLVVEDARKEEESSEEEDSEEEEDDDESESEEDTASCDSEEEEQINPLALWVGNLPYDLDKASFSAKLREVGISHKTAIPIKRKTGQGAGFGFIHFANEKEREKAEKVLANVHLGGRPLVVKPAIRRENDASEEEEEEQPKKKPNAKKATAGSAGTPGNANANVARKPRPPQGQGKQEKQARKPRVHEKGSEKPKVKSQQGPAKPKKQEGASKPKDAKPKSKKPKDEAEKGKSPKSNKKKKEEDAMPKIIVQVVMNNSK